AANRIQCANNLKQIGLAFHQYYDSYGTFPPGNTDTPANHTWSVFLLPYLEQENLYKQYQWDKNWKHVNNQKVVNTRLKVMQCPSTPDPDRIDTLPDTGTTKTAAVGDYAPPNSVAQSLIDLEPPLVQNPGSGNNGGVPAAKKGVRIAEVTDGTSMTIMVSQGAGPPTHS